MEGSAHRMNLGKWGQWKIQHDTQISSLGSWVDGLTEPFTRRGNKGDHISDDIFSL